MTLRRFHSSPSRTGITLLEVVIALVILGAGVLSLRTASSIGQRATAIATQQREGIRRGRMVLDEIVAGIRDPESHTSAFQDNPEWMYQLEIEKESESLLHATISVHRQQANSPVVVLDRWIAQRRESP